MVLLARLACKMRKLGYNQCLVSGPRVDLLKGYLTLWCNGWLDSFLQAPRAEKLPFEVGYTSKRRGIEWCKQISSLIELEFIETKQGSSGDDE